MLLWMRLLRARSVLLWMHLLLLLLRIVKSNLHGGSRALWGNILLTIHWVGVDDKKEEEMMSMVVM